MTVIKLIKEVSVTGDETWHIGDQDGVQIGATYKFEFDALRAFEKVKKSLEIFGNLKRTEVIKEFIHSTNTQ